MKHNIKLTPSSVAPYTPEGDFIEPRSAEQILVQGPTVNNKFFITRGLQVWSAGKFRTVGEPRPFDSFRSAWITAAGLISAQHGGASS